MTVVITFAVETSSSSPVFLFAVANDGLDLNLQTWSLDDFAQKNNFIRHEDFDWAVGDGGAKAALFENSQTSRLLSVLTPHGPKNVKWLNFQSAARQLVDGNQRRLLQLAVQFLANGAKVDDSVIAAPADDELKDLLNKNS